MQDCCACGIMILVVKSKNSYYFFSCTLYYGVNSQVNHIYIQKKMDLSTQNLPIYILELQMRHQMQRQEKEMSKTNKKLAVIMKHLGFVGSSSHVSNPNSESNEHIDEEDNNDFFEDDHDFSEDVDEDNNSYHIDN